MAEQQERVEVNMEQNTERNTNNNPPDVSNYQAWAQYWQYYYSYYMYYYTSYYYLALTRQNSAGVFTPSLAANIPQGVAVNGARTLPQNVPAGLRQRLVNGGVVEIFDLRQRTEPEQRYEYKVASLWKRIFAEFIDFVFLYFLKTGLSTAELSKIENEYIRNLQQQIYFLELEANYLRDQAKKATVIPPRVTEEADKMMRKLRALQSELDDRVTDLAKKESAIRVLEDEREAAIRKLRETEETHAQEKKQLVNEIVSLKKFKDNYERESSRREVHVKQVETEANKGLDAIRDAEERIQMLRNQLDDKTEEFNRCRVELEQSRSECLKHQTQLREMEERFFQSDAKSKDEIGRELREEIRQLRLEARQKEINSQQDRTLRSKIQEDCTSLIKENAALAAQVVELRKQIDADRAHEDEKVVRRQANIQELVVLKDSERRLLHELEITKEQLRSEQQKYREAAQKLTREEQNAIHVRLSKNKLRSNVEELQSLNTIQNDENITLQRDKLLLTDEICDLQSKLDDKNEEISELKIRLHEADSRCSQLESKVKMQKSLESIKWEEFHKLANTMSEFSRSMSPRKTKDLDYDD